jgi:heme/copper-type cytochrome/quinol oxidase subunit 2
LIVLCIYFLFFIFFIKKREKEKEKEKKPQAVSGLLYPFQAVHFIIQSKEKLSAIGQ